jgi:REP-associated tyrosine transposase
MAHTLSRNYVHVIFGTKDRRKTITQDLQPRLWAYLAGIGKNHDIGMLAVGGTEDHVHILLHLPPKIPLAKAVVLFKSNSSKWMNEATEFSWQEGYGAFSVSASNLDAVIRYVRNQRQHHRKLGFEEELRAILQKHGVAHDPRDLAG